MFNSANPSRACFKCDATGLTEGCWSLRKTPTTFGKSINFLKHIIR